MCEHTHTHTRRDRAQERQSDVLWEEARSEKGRGQKLPLLPGRQVTNLGRSQPGPVGMPGAWQAVLGTRGGGTAPQDSPEVLVLVEVVRGAVGARQLARGGPQAKASV